MHYSDLNISYINPLKKRFSIEFFKRIDQLPGVYFMRNEKGTLLYIGKAKNLQSRVKSYCSLKPGRANDHTLELLEYVKSIDWLVCSSEEEALSKEYDLIHALRPPYNILHTEAEHYSFIGIRYSYPSYKDISNEELILSEFCFSTKKPPQKDFLFFGCFRSKAKIKLGYISLLRLIFATTFQKSRFSYPAKLSQAFVPWTYTTAIPKRWIQEVNAFFLGRSATLLEFIFDDLLRNDNIPSFMRYSLQDDFMRATEFFNLGPNFTYNMIKKHHLNTRTITKLKMDQLIGFELPIKPFNLNNL
jgi:predicted GIY-YIG superfamily endonuclease